MTQIMHNFDTSGTTTSSSFKKERETIHSGQFMVSHIEDVETKEEDDEKISIPIDEEDDTEMEIQQSEEMSLKEYNPNILGHNEDSIICCTNNNQLLIETSLAKLFDCMQVTYKQKLTSPKWNHFKGVRMSWKDKIRLNNLIWRCWHSQFIMRKKILKCQFASPIDTEGQIRPEAIVLEGKYWKRNRRVVRIEYRKWRVSFVDPEKKNSSDTICVYNESKDNRFEPFDPFDYNFPNSEFIDFGARRAEFIQPSLEPLHPSFDDFLKDPIFDDYGMPDQIDLFGIPSRLPSVPEEGIDFMEKGDNIFNRLPIMDSDDLNSSRITDITSQSNQVPAMQNDNRQQQNTVNSNYTAQNLDYVQNYTNDDFNSETDMVIDSYSSNTNQNNETISAQENQLDINNITNYSKGRRFMRRGPHIYDKLTNQPTSNQTIMFNHIVAQQSQQQQQQQTQSNLFDSAYHENANLLQGLQHTSPIQTTTNNYSFQNLGGQPTSQQDNSPQNVLNLSSNTQQQHAAQNAIQIHHNMNAKYLTQTSNLQNLLVTNNIPRNLNGVQNVQRMIPHMSIGSGAGGVGVSGSNVAQQSQINPATVNAIQSVGISTAQQQQQQQQQDLPQQDSFKALSSHQLGAQSESSYKPYHNPHLYKMNGGVGGSSGSSYSSIGVRNQMRHKSPPSTNNLSEQQQQAAKEMYRSHSLPINAKLQFPQQPKEENFIIPKYQAKTKPPRPRSNSIVNKPQAILPATLQTAISEPSLNTTNPSVLLQQLLTSTGSTHNLMNRQVLVTNPLSSQSAGTTSPNISQLFSTSVLNSGIVGGGGSSSGVTAVMQSQSNRTTNVKSPPTFASTNLPYNFTNSSNFSSTSGQNILNFTTNQKQSSQQQQQQQHQQQQQQQKDQGIKSPNSPLTPNGPNLSPESVLDIKMDSPLSPTRNANSSSTSRYPRGESQRRVVHIHAEQKRRYNIKNGFDTLHSLIPQLHQNPNAKLSKAAMLQKGAEYIKQLRTERTVTNDQMEILKRERDSLSNSLNHLHSILPANGAPVSRQRTGRMQEMYNEYIHRRTIENWKFWIFGLIFEPLLSSYTSTVSVASVEEFYRTAKLWVDQNCSLVELRPAVSNKLRYLSTTTDILSDPPSTLQEEVIKAIAEYKKNHPNQ